MKPERWRKVETLCQKAMNLQGAERTAYLEHACAGDKELLEEVTSLLDHEDSKWLQQPLVQVQSSFVFSDDQSVSDQTIGPYRIIKTIASGGMGQVYLGVRNDDQFERFVALKVIRKGLVSEDVLNRFYEERQILASLNHPNIARLFDGGTTEDGIPWFAMEYIKGEPITEYCKQHNLTVEEKINLFLTVCSAVQYAHQNLVIHRDLKPENILITPDGTPKLLDFGIAKLMDLEQKSGQTQYQDRIMTPDYASPEQVRNESISTVSDVYALGILLYELLTGALPYQFEKRTPAEIERTICNTIPKQPSAVSDLRILKGDLDSVIMKALRKEPSERYASVEQLANDLRRYQKALPVLAQKSSFTYRARKFLSRHKWSAAVSAAVALLVIVFATITFMQSKAIEARAIEAEQQRDRAEHVVDFLVNLFEASDPAQSEGETITARELLERGSKRIEEELGEQPEMRAEMTHVIARVYASLDLNSQAERLVRRSLSTRRKLLGADHPDVATSQNLLAELLRTQGKYMAADSLHRATLSMRKKLLGETHPDVAASQEYLALVLHDQGKYKEAESLYREALSVRRAHHDSAHTDIATSLYNLAWVLHDQGDYEEAESLYRKALDIRRQLNGEDHPDVAASLNNLGWLLHDKGDFSAAEAVLRKALALRRKLLGNQHSSIAQTLSTLARTLRAQNDYDEAEALYREALAIYRNQLGDEHSYVAGALSNLALVLHDKGDLKAAEDLYREALTIQRKIHGEIHPYVAATLSNLGSLLRDLGSFGKAAQLFEEVLSIDRELYGGDHRYIATDIHNIAELKFKQENHQQAESLFAQALEIYRKTLPEKHPNTANALMWLGRAQVQQNKFKQAAPLFREALKIRLEKFGNVDQRTTEAQLALGRCLTDLVQYEAAEPLLKKSYAALQNTQSENANLIRNTRQALVDLYEAWGRPLQANPYRSETE